MIDIFSSALASAKTASDMGKTILELRDGEKVRAAVFELRTQLMDLQERMLNAKEEQMRLLEKVAHLETQLNEAKSEAIERDRYERFQFPTGYFAYALKEEYKGRGPTYFLCTKCYESGKQVTMHQWEAHLWCPECRVTIRTIPVEE